MCLPEVDIDPIQLKVAVTLIVACCVEPMFITDHFPKLERQNHRNIICFCLCVLINQELMQKKV